MLSLLFQWDCQWKLEGLSKFYASYLPWAYKARASHLDLQVTLLIYFIVWFKLSNLLYFLFAIWLVNQTAKLHTQLYLKTCSCFSQISCKFSWAVSHSLLIMNYIFSVEIQMQCFQSQGPDTMLMLWSFQLWLHGMLGMITDRYISFITSNEIYIPNDERIL